MIEIQIKQYIFATNKQNLETICKKKEKKGKVLNNFKIHVIVWISDTQKSYSNLFSINIANNSLLKNVIDKML